MFGAVFDRHFDAVFGYFARRVSRADAGDLAGETFQVAFTQRHRYDPGFPSARPWLYGIAGNVLRHHARHAARHSAAVRRLSTVPDVTTSRDEAGVDAALDASMQWRLVEAALQALSDEDRETILLLAWEALTYAEIAAATGVPIGTVRSRIHRARRQLRELIGPDGQSTVETSPPGGSTP